jgi:hypothetical protein
LSYQKNALGFTNFNFPIIQVPIIPGGGQGEPGIIPESLTEQLLLAQFYPTIEAMAEAGGQSRINGGMHLGAAIPAAEELCMKIGDKSTDYLLDLLGG